MKMIPLFYPINKSSTCGLSVKFLMELGVIKTLMTFLLYHNQVRVLPALLVTVKNFTAETLHALLVRYKNEYNTDEGLYSSQHNQASQVVISHDDFTPARESIFPVVDG